MTKASNARRLAQQGLAVALAGLFAVAAAAAQTDATIGSVQTRTTLDTESLEVGGHTVTAYSATVLDQDGAPAKGIVMLAEHGKNLAGAALDADGKAHIRLDGLTAGQHQLQAIYTGDSVHAASHSGAVPVQAAIAADSFALTIVPTSVSVAAAGDAGNVIATITPGSNFTGFVSLSCAGPPVSPGSSTDSALPFGVSCTFTPQNLQVNSSTGTFTSAFTVQTTAPSGKNASNDPAAGSIPRRGNGSPLALAILLPGIAGLGLLGRKRKLFGRVALVLLVGSFAVLGTSACNARYRYLNHPPTYNPGTVPGAYTLTIWAQTSNGVTATELFTTMPLTVK